MHRQGYHWSPTHDEYRGRILEHIRRIKPAFGFVMTEDWTPLQEAYDAHPHRICARVWAIDDGRSDSDSLGAYRLLRDDPEAAAQQLMQRYLDKRAEWREHGLSIPDERLFGHAWNEANAMASYSAIVAATKALLRLAIRHNFPFAVIAESVGNPYGLHPDGTPDWGVYDDRELESLINDSGSVADIRGYWQAEGPLHSWTDETGKLREDYPHLAGRHHGWPLDTPIVIGECGVDGTIFNRNDAWGFANYGISARDYSRQQMQNHDRLDPRVLSQCPWQLDCADRKWGGYNYVAALDDIEQWVAQAPPAEHTVHIPVITVGEPEQPEPPDADWQRAIDFVLRWEGELSLDPQDPGNYYDGQLVGTKFGISAAVWGGMYDIPNLTEEQAEAIYRQHYWQASGADKLAWPACLLVFDSAVLHGVGAAAAWVKEVGPDPLAISAKRLGVYVGSKHWHAYGNAWVRRVAELLAECAKG